MLDRPDNPPDMRNALVLLFLVACGASAREKTINATLASTDAITTAFVSYDATHQAELARSAPDRSTAETKLGQWREVVSTVQVAIVTVYRAIAIAASANDDPSVASMLKTAADLAKTLKTAGVP